MKEGIKEPTTEDTISWISEYEDLNVMFCRRPLEQVRFCYEDCNNRPSEGSTDLPARWYRKILAIGERDEAK